ncbi:MAG: membrane protein insertase YidC [Cytophagales bacterium]|nr:MAG: membrane protein insertase YidC [Cytophagales bacterium]
MDRNQIIGLTLLFLILTLYFQFILPSENTTQKTEKKTTQTEQQVRLTDPNTAKIEANKDLPDSVRTLKDQELVGDFAKVIRGEEKSITVKTKELTVVFQQKGGRINTVYLNEYKDANTQKPIQLIDDRFSQMIWNLTDVNGKNINVYQLFFTTEEKESTINIQGEQKKQIVFRASLSPEQYIEQIYTLQGEGFTIDYQVRTKGLEKVLKNNPAQFQWLLHMQNTESDIQQTRIKTTLNYYSTTNGFDYLSETSADPREAKPEVPLHWISFKQKFFASALIAKNHNLTAVHLKQGLENLESTTILKTGMASFSVPFSDLSAGKADFTFYFGPNRYQTLYPIAEGFYKNVDLGWPVVNLFTAWLIVPLFSILENSIGEYGAIILLLMVIIRILLLPLSYRSYISMAKMKVMKPELDEIKERLVLEYVCKAQKVKLSEGEKTVESIYQELSQKHKADVVTKVKDEVKVQMNQFQLPQEIQSNLQAEQMKLYNQVGINPLSGCLPLLLQMPFLLAMFSFFPNAIELRQQSFLWATDLSNYDSIYNLPFNIPFYGQHVSLFTILMTASTIGFTYLNNQNTPNLQPQMKTMGYIMPLMFMFILNTLPAGLSYYYFASNLFSIAQQLIIRRFVDEEGLKTKLQENKEKNKNKKVSSFMQRLMDAQKAAEEKQKAKQQQQKNK